MKTHSVLLSLLFAPMLASAAPFVPTAQDQLPDIRVECSSQAAFPALRNPVVVNLVWRCSYVDDGAFFCVEHLKETPVRSFLLIDNKDGTFVLYDPRVEPQIIDAHFDIHGGLKTTFLRQTMMDSGLKLNLECRTKDGVTT